MLEGLATILDNLLSRNPHYDYCRRLGQLAPARVFITESNASAIYLDTCRARGQRLPHFTAAAVGTMHSGDGTSRRRYSNGRWRLHRATDAIYFDSPWEGRVGVRAEPGEATPSLIAP